MWARAISSASSKSEKTGNRLHYVHTNSTSPARNPVKMNSVMAQRLDAKSRLTDALLLRFGLKKKRTRRAKEPNFHHSVYVILLDNAVAKHRSILRLNPNRDPLKPCAYVGMTGIPVEHRFENHKNGYKSAWVVKKYGLRLMPELYEHLNPMPFEAPAQMGEGVGRRFASRGLHGHGRYAMAFSPRCFAASIAEQGVSHWPTR